MTTKIHPEPGAALAEPFEHSREHLQAVAYRMLGSLSEAEDAVQEAWLRLSRADTSGVVNLRAWLTTVVSRVCLDMLRSRRARREEPLDTSAPNPAVAPADPEQETVLADSVGLALLVVLDTLAPAERLAFVLHDMFAVPFDEIAGIVGRSPTAARQLASRARRRIQGAAPAAPAELAGQRAVVAAFLAALRSGDFHALVSVLAPEVVVRSDRAAAPPDGYEVRGAETWARQAMRFTRGARAVDAVLVDGTPGLVLARHGRAFRVLRLAIAGGRVTEIEIIGDAARLDALDLAVLRD